MDGLNYKRRFTSFDLLALSETWLAPSIPNRLLTINGYSLHRADRPVSSGLANGHGGVAILARECYSVTVLPTPATTNTNRSNIEVVWAKVGVKKRRQIVFASVYRHPTNTRHQVEADLSDFESQLQYFLTQYPGATFVIAGDFNLCLIKNEPQLGGKLSEMLTNHNLHLANTTRPTYRPAGTLLDIIATNRPSSVTRKGVTRCHYGTPHDFTRIVLRHVTPTRRRGAVVETRSFSRINDASFNWTLSASDWSGVYLAESPEDKWMAFLAVFTPLLDSAAPCRRVRLPPPEAPHVTDGTRALLAQRRRLLATRHCRADYKQLNRQCQAAVRRDQAAYFADKLREAGPSKMWSVLRPIIGSGKETTAAPACTPDALNAYYVTVGPNTAASVPSPTAPLPVIIPRVMTCAFRPRSVTYDSLYSLVHSMKRSTFSGLDGVSVETFRRFFHGMGHILLDIVNCSLETGLVPFAWKRALVTPIPKGPDSSEPRDTRPISMLPGIMKIVERVVQRQVTAYFNDNQLFTDAQHGYRRGRSTETALAVITDKVYRAMDRGEISILVLIDLSKCFDVVCHEKMLEKLDLYNVDTAWFRNYLHEHTQQVKVRNTDGSVTISQSLPITSGIFQGGSLSCLLFSIFANDMSLHVPDVTIVQFADDTQLLVSGRKADLAGLISKMESALSTLFTWFCSNDMKVNAAKTQMIVLGTRQMLNGLPSVSIRFAGTIVRESATVKNLGLVMDRHLHYHDHVNRVVSKCTGALLALNHVKHVLPIPALQPIVSSLVVSSLRYCISVYGTCGATELHRVQKVLNFCARVISGRRKHSHVSDVLKDLRWLSAANLVLYHRICMVRTIVQTGQPSGIALMLHSATDHGHDTRHARRLRLPQIHTEEGRRQLLYSGIDAYNQFCAAYDGQTSFMKAVRRYLLQDQTP